MEVLNKHILAEGLRERMADKVDEGLPVDEAVAKLAWTKQFFKLEEFEQSQPKVEKRKPGKFWWSE